MSEITLRPIGIVLSERLATQDDNWGSVVSRIELDPLQFGEEALQGLSEFSHLEVIYQFHLVEEAAITTGARHPRNNPDWPKTGIFAQRVKSRPNRLGVSRASIIEVVDLTIVVRGLDAINGTPVLDIKPYMQEFGPIGTVVQPKWSRELMREYYK